MKANGEWRGVVHLGRHRSVLSDYTTQIPLSGLDFEGEHGELIVYLMASCPGIFNGDHQTIAGHIHEGAHLFLTDTSATELHPSATNEAIQQKTEFILEKNSILEYMPEPIIPFKDSNFNGRTTLHMSEGSQAIVCEIVTAGRVGRGEIFEYISYKSQLDVYWNGELTAWDSIQLDPHNHLNRQGVLGNYTHFGTLWLLSEKLTRSTLQSIQSSLQQELDDNNCYGGVSSLHTNGIVIRLAGYNSESIQSVMKKYWDDFRIEFIKLDPIEILK